MRSWLLRLLLTPVACAALLVYPEPAHASALICQVQMVRNGPTYVVNAVVVNTEAAPLTNWTVRFTAPMPTNTGYPNHATLTFVGTAGTLTPAFYYATLAPGAAAVIGFSGSVVHPSQWPHTFHLNGMPCQINYY